MIAGEAPPASYPGQRAFDDPSFGDHLEASGRVAIPLPGHLASFPHPLARTFNPRLFENVDRAFQMFFQPGGEWITVKALVGPYQITSGKILLAAWPQEAFGCLPIPRIGSSDDDRHEQAQRLNHQGAFASPDFFSPRRSPSQDHARHWF